MKSYILASKYYDKKDSVANVGDEMRPFEMLMTRIDDGDRCW